MRPLAADTWRVIFGCHTRILSNIILLLLRAIVPQSGKKSKPGFAPSIGAASVSGVRRAGERRAGRVSVARQTGEGRAAAGGSRLTAETEEGGWGRFRLRAETESHR